jgi:hypothetical protein
MGSSRLQTRLIRSAVALTRQIAVPVVRSNSATKPRVRCASTVNLLTVLPLLYDWLIAAVITIETDQESGLC